MLHTKFQGNQPSGSGEEDFLRFLPYMGIAAILVMWPGRNIQIFFPPLSRGCIWNLIEIGPVVSEEKSFENVDGQPTDDGDYHPISSLGAFGSGELKMFLQPSEEMLRLQPSTFFVKIKITKYSQCIISKSPNSSQTTDDWSQKTYFAIQVVWDIRN